MITASMVKELRERTGAGMMDCKKALTACDGDMEKSIDWLREKGIAKAAKKNDRIAAEGLTRAAVNGNTGVVFEVNSETDFVAKNEKFLGLLDEIQGVLIENKPADLDAALACAASEGTVADAVTTATATIGEKISLRRIAVVEKADDEFFGCYMHMGGKISALVTLKGKADEAVAKNIAMQIAAMNAKYVDRSEVPQDFVEKEKEILKVAAMNENPDKPENIIDKMIIGRLNKELKEICLVDQVYVKDGDLTVQKYVDSVAKEVGAPIKIKSFVRYETGEGMEKKEENFAEEVAKQMAGN